MENLGFISGIGLNAADEVRFRDFHARNQRVQLTSELA